MGFVKGHRDNTRRHIVRIAAQLFREEGIEKIGVAAVMLRAGLTVGGFYNFCEGQHQDTPEDRWCHLGCNGWHAPTFSHRPQ